MDLAQRNKKSKMQRDAPVAAPVPAPTPAPAPTNSPNQTQPDQKVTDELPDVNTLHEGWVKYFHFKKGDQSKPNTFFKNEMFAKQISKDPPIPDDQVNKPFIS